MQSKTNIIKQLWKRLFKSAAKPTPYQTMCSEAKEEGFHFSVYEGDREYVVPAENVDIFFDRIELTTDDNKKYTIAYSQLTEVQTRLKTKTVNLILREKLPLREAVLYFIPSLLATGIFFFYSQLAKFVPHDPEWVILIIGFIVLILSYTFIIASANNTERKWQETRLRAVSAGRAQIVVKKLEEAADQGIGKYFSRLINANVENIERYYSLIEEQANKSYRLSRSGAYAGFLLLSVGIVVSLFFPGTDKSTSTLTVASGLIVEFISAVFFYLYNRTIQELDTYHKRLIEVQNTMLALRIVDEIKNDETTKNQTLQDLTRSLMLYKHTEEQDTPNAKTGEST